MSVDPLAGDYPFYTAYQYAGNKPINFIDLDGKEEKPPEINSPINRDWMLSTNRKGALGQVGNFFSGLYNVLMGTLGALSELPGQSHYGQRVKPKDQNITFPLTAGQNFQTLFVGAIVAPIIAVGEFIKNPTFGNAGELVGTVFLYKSVDKFGVPKIPKVNIALGRYAKTGTKADLKSFAELKNAKHSHDWEAAGLYKREQVQGFGEAFKQVMDVVKKTDGQIFFDLTDLNIKDALAGDPNLFVGRYTAWELQQIVRDPNLFSRTKFYLNGMELNKTQLNNLGVKLEKNK